MSFFPWKLNPYKQIDILIWSLYNYSVIHLDNGLTALLISDTNSVTRRQHHDSSKSTTDEEDTESEDLEGESCDNDDDDDDDDEVHEDDDGIDEDENDVTDGVTSVGLDTEEENGSERSRKAKDTKLVSEFYFYQYIPHKWFALAGWLIKKWTASTIHLWTAEKTELGIRSLISNHFSNFFFKEIN